MPVSLFVLLITSVVAVSADITKKSTTGDKCICLTKIDVHARDRAGINSNVVATVHRGGCYTVYNGQRVARDGRDWYLVRHRSQFVWITGKYLAWGAFSSGQCDNGYECAESIIVPMKVWSRLVYAPMIFVKQTLSSPVNMVIIHHAAGNPCFDTESCTKAANGIQNYYMSYRGLSDTGFNFLVGEDGKVYEGRGWTEVGAHTERQDLRSLDFLVIGTFSVRLPNQEAFDAIHSTIRCGVDQGFISGDYTLYGHRDISRTDCPGDALYKAMETWPHYSTQKP